MNQVEGRLRLQEQRFNRMLEAEEILHPNPIENGSFGGGRWRPRGSAFLRMKSGMLTK
jgi:hypothetical protein